MCPLPLLELICKKKSNMNLAMVISTKMPKTIVIVSLNVNICGTHLYQIANFNFLIQHKNGMYVLNRVFASYCLKILTYIPMKMPGKKYYLSS